MYNFPLMKEFDLDSLLQSPEFLVRCHAFLDEIGELVSPKYPELEFEAVDLTEARISGLNVAIDYILRTFKVGITRESFIKQTRMQASREDRLSAERNLAIVNVFSRGREDFFINRVRQAAGEVRIVARRYQAETVIEEIALDEFPVVAHFLFSFCPPGMIIPAEDLL